MWFQLLMKGSSHIYLLENVRWSIQLDQLFFADQIFTFS